MLKHEVANYGVPHGRFKKTEEGFVYTFRRVTPLSAVLPKKMSHNTRGVAGASFDFGQLIAQLMGSIIYVFYSIMALSKGTTITVTKNEILIGIKRLKRADFGSFVVRENLNIPEERYKYAYLGYTYGRRSFKFGGPFIEGEATEVASALNKQLNLTPSTAELTRVSPESLRTTSRPSDF